MPAAGPASRAERRSLRLDPHPSSAGAASGGRNSKHGAPNAGT